MEWAMDKKQERRQRILKFVSKLPVRDLGDAIDDMEAHLDRLIQYEDEGYKYVQIYGPFYLIAREK